MDSDSNLPFILNGYYFKIVQREGNSVTAQCQNCPNNKTFKGGVTSTSNFLTHVKRMHSDKVAEYNELQKEDVKKRKLAVASGTSFQPKRIKDFVQVNHTKSLSRIENLILNFIVQGMHPLSTVSQSEFQDLLKGLNPDAPVMSRSTLTRRLNTKHSDMKISLTRQMETARYICITADAWTCDGMSRSFMGCTAHWISEDLRRMSVALACSRFKGSHTFDKIAAKLHEIFLEYNIPLSKIVKAITDNGSNFVKAFSAFGEEALNAAGVSENDDGEDEVAEVEFESLDTAIRDSVENGIEELELMLPPHHRCSSHTLSLICTTDIKSLTSRIWKSAFAKANGIWNKSSRSTQFAEKVKEVCGVSLTTPCATRWNSLYDSLQGLLKQKSKLRELCNSVDLPPLTDREWEFVEEYCQCVKPIAQALDRLQGEHNTFYGELIPTLINVEKKLLKMQTIKPKQCEPLPAALLKGLHKRFEKYLNFNLDHKDAVIATISHPYFKLRWAPLHKLDELKELFLATVLSEKSENLDTSAAAVSIPNTEMKSADDFFEFEEFNVTSQGTEKFENEIKLQVINYLSDPNDDVNMLNLYPNIKQVFIKYNTPLPSSAPVERLFNYSNMIFCPNRRRLSDGNFELLTLLKVNKY